MRVAGLAAMVPLMGIMYTSKHTHSTTLRAGLFAAFTGLSGIPRRYDCVQRDRVERDRLVGDQTPGS